ncbi:MAG: type IX secretion system outer membrane channel protein PorV [Bacteroidota bacterium]
MIKAIRACGSLALLTITSLSITIVHAQADVDMRVVGSAVPFLRISPDTRSGGMADVGIATAPDANAAFYNNAKAVFAKDKGSIGVNYIPWMKDEGFNDVFMATVSGYYKPDVNTAFTGSMRYFSLGNIQFVDISGNKLDLYRPREMAFDVGLAKKLNEKFSVGAALRVINSTLAANQYIGGKTYESATAFAADLSLFYNTINKQGNGLTAGLALTNLGSKISYTQDTRQKDYIPANIGLGVAYTKLVDSRHKLLFGADFNKLLVPTPPDNKAENYVANLENYYNKSVVTSWFSSFGDAGSFSNEIKEVNLAGGAEYIYDDMLMIRAGYFFESKEKGNRQYATAGAGFKFNLLTVNFAYLLPTGSGIDRSPLSNTMRFGVTFNAREK